MFAWQPGKAWLQITTWLQSRVHFLAVPCFQVMQTVLNFGPVLFARSSKCCLWISSKLFSSSNGYSSHGQTPREIVKWMGEHAPCVRSEWRRYFSVARTESIFQYSKGIIFE